MSCCRTVSNDPINLFILVNNNSGGVFTLSPGKNTFPASSPQSFPSNPNNLVTINSRPSDYTRLSQTNSSNTISGTISGWDGILPNTISNINLDAEIYLDVIPSEISGELPTLALNIIIRNQINPIQINSYPSLTLKFTGQNFAQSNRSRYFFLTANSGILTDGSIVIPAPASLSNIELQALAANPGLFQVYSSLNLSTTNGVYPVVGIDTKGASNLGSVYLYVSNGSIVAKVVNKRNIAYAAQALFVRDNCNNEEIQSVVFNLSNYL